MSVRQLVKVWDHHFSPSEQQLALALADFADDDGGSMYPSIARLVWKTELSESTIHRLFRKWRKDGFLVTVRLATRRSATEYRFDWEKATPKMKYAAWCAERQALEEAARGVTKAPLEEVVRGVTVTPLEGSGVSLEEVRGVTDDSLGVSQLDTRSVIDPSYDPLRSYGASAAPLPNRSQTGPKKKGAGQPRDPLLDHPAVIAYRDIMHLTPNDLQRAAIAQAVCDDQLDRWKEVLRGWKVAGHKPGSVDKILDKFGKENVHGHERFTHSPAARRGVPGVDAGTLAALDALAAASG